MINPLSNLAQSIKENLDNIRAIDPTEIKRFRHKAENPLYLLCILITIVVVCVGITSDTGDFIVQYFMEDDEWDLFTAIFVLPVIIIFVLYYQYASTRAYAIKVTEKNFPEIYYKSLEFAKKLNIKKIPPVYIEQQNGILNAFAASIFGRRYCMLNAELVDVAYMEHKDFDTVFFILAHEYGHHYYKHADFKHIALVFLAHLIPVFGALHSRAREYSCDRIAQLLLGRDGVQEAMILSAGRHLYKHVDAQDYLEDMKNGKEFLPRLINLFATHPIMSKRIAALADPEKKSGKLL